MYIHSFKHKHVYDSGAFDFVPEDKCIQVNVPSIREIQNLYVRTGNLPPSVQLLTPAERQGNEDFDTDISSRNPKYQDLNDLFYGMQDASQKFNEKLTELGEAMKNASTTINENSGD